MCFLATTCAYNVGSCRPARFFVAGPSFVLAVETLCRKIERSNLVAHQPARDQRSCRIKYHNAPSTSIGIRCNQFGRGPKAAACKSRQVCKASALATPMEIKCRRVVNRSVHEHSIQAWFPADRWKTRKTFSENRNYCKWYEVSSVAREI